MAWSIGPFSVRRGSTVEIGFFWDGDPGVQAIQVFPRRNIAGGGGIAVLESADLELSGLRIENQAGLGEGGRDRIVYRVSVTHRGATVFALADPAEFDIRGGRI